MSRWKRVENTYSRPVACAICERLLGDNIWRRIGTNVCSQECATAFDAPENELAEQETAQQEATA